MADEVRGYTLALVRVMRAMRDRHPNDDFKVREAVLDALARRQDQDWTDSDLDEQRSLLTQVAEKWPR